MSRTPTVLGPLDSARALSVLAPLVAQGAIVRRPAVTAWAERRQVDLRVSRVLADLRRRTGGGPAVVRLPGRTLAFVLDPADVTRVLDGTPSPFRADTREKRAALRKFQPGAVLISPPSQRGARRAANVAALEPRREQHSLGDRFDEHADRAVEATVARATAAGRLTWPMFTRGFESAFRAVALGEQAFDDTELTARLTRLRAAGNWAYLTTARSRDRAAFTEHLEVLVQAAPRDSLAGQLRARSFGAAATGQVPHWLFAFDAAGAATYRALAVAAARPALARALIAEADAPAAERPTARGSVLESVRLWPTTLVVLRESSEVTTWGDGELPERTGLVIVSSFFHRDSSRVPFAHSFEPEVWNDGRAEADRALISFSTGPAGCPGRDVVAAVAGRFLARTLRALALDGPRAGHLARDPLPWTFDHAGLELRVAPRARARATITTTRSDRGVS